MDYKQYWDLCRRTSMIEQGYGPAKDVPAELCVLYDGIPYYPEAYEVRWYKGQSYRRAILHDLHADSLTYGDLDKVEAYDEGTHH